MISENASNTTVRLCLKKGMWNNLFRSFSSIHGQGHWLAEKGCFALFSSLTGIDMAKLNEREIQQVFDTFHLIMYVNRNIDLLVPRMQRGYVSHAFLEDYWNIPDRITEIQGIPTADNNQLKDWFRINRTLNFLLRDPSTEDTEELRQTAVILNDERQILIHDAITSDLSQKNFTDEVQRSIYLRALSSHGFIYPMLELASCKDLNDGVWFSNGTMVMIAQVMDDFSSVAKDVSTGVKGMITRPFKSDNLFPPIRATHSQTDEALTLAHDIIGGSVDALKFETPSLHAVSLGGIFGMGMISAFKNRAKYGGTYYPMLYSSVAGVKGFLEGEKHTAGYRDFTNHALLGSFATIRSIYRH